MTDNNLDLQSLTRLEEEITNKAGVISNAVVMRAEHPSYGYRKGIIRSDLDQLRGMLMAWLIVSGNWQWPAAPLLVTDTRETIQRQLGIDLLALQKEVDNA